MSWLAGPFKLSSVAIMVQFYREQHLLGERAQSHRFTSLSCFLYSTEEALCSVSPPLQIWMVPDGWYWMSPSFQLDVKSYRHEGSTVKSSHSIPMAFWPAALWGSALSLPLLSAAGLLMMKQLRVIWGPTLASGCLLSGETQHKASSGAKWVLVHVCCWQKVFPARCH